MGCLLSYLQRTDDAQRRATVLRTELSPAHRLTLQPPPVVDEHAVMRHSRQQALRECCRHWTTTEDMERTCPICLDPFAAGAALTTLPCLHMYHEPCAVAWLTRRGVAFECPECQTQIAASEHRL